MDAVIWLIIAALIGFGLFQSGQFPPIAVSWNLILTGAGILFVARLLQGVVAIPPRLYFKAQDDKANAENEIKGRDDRIRKLEI